MEEPWIIAVDGELMNRSRVSIDEIFELSEYISADLLSTVRFPEKSVKLYYKMNGGKFFKLERYDVLPAYSSILLVSGRLRDLMFDICGEREVAAFEAIITSKYGETMSGWNVVPRLLRPCVDLKKSNVRKWIVENESPMFLDSIELHPGCMGGHNFVRDQGAGRFIFVSSKLKDAIEELNSHGVKFFRSSDYRDGAFRADNA